MRRQNWLGSTCSPFLVLSLMTPGEQLCAFCVSRAAVFLQSRGECFARADELRQGRPEQGLNIIVEFGHEHPQITRIMRIKSRQRIDSQKIYSN